MEGKESLLVYVMNRMAEIPYLDFVLAQQSPENSKPSFASRRNLMTGGARCVMSPEYRSELTKHLHVHGCIVDEFTARFT